MSDRFVHYADVESQSRPGKYYEVKQDTQLTQSPTMGLSCSCPAWRFQSLPTTERICKHTRTFIDGADGDPNRLARIGAHLQARPDQGRFRNESDLQAAVLEAML